MEKKMSQVFFMLNIQSRKEPDKTTVIIHTATTLPKRVGGWGGGGVHSFSTYTANWSKLPFHIFFSTPSQMKCAGKSNFLFEKKSDVQFHDLVGVLFRKQIMVHCWHFHFSLCGEGLVGHWGLALLSLQCTRGPQKSTIPSSLPKQHLDARTSIFCHCMTCIITSALG